MPVGLDAWRRALRTAAPDLGARVDAGTVRGPLRGAVGLPNHRREAYGPGWAPVGDAGYHRDPVTGHGITEAFRDATERAALDDYQRARGAAVTETFALTRALGAFPPPDRVHAAADRAEPGPRHRGGPARAALPDRLSGTVPAAR